MVRLLLVILVTISSLNAAPVIYKFYPTSGMPGDSFTISGTNLNQVKLLFIGGYSCSFQWQTNDTLVVTVPDAAVNGSITLYAADQVVESQAYFAVTLPKLPPSLIGFDPVTAVPGARVSIVGSNLLGATSVAFAGVPGDFLVTANTRILATVPDKAS